MPDYLATFRYVGAKVPHQVQFQADGVGSALTELIMAAKVKDTGSLEDYDILEILQDGRSYKPVAAKISTNVPLRQEASRTTPTVIAPPKTEVVKPEEQVYDNYKFIIDKENS